MNLQDPNYHPNAFVNWMHEVFNVKNDAKLALKLEMSPPLISKIRYRKEPVPAHMIIAVHEETGMRTLDIKARMFKPAADAGTDYVRQAE